MLWSPVLKRLLPEDFVLVVVVVVVASSSLDFDDDDEDNKSVMLNELTFLAPVVVGVAVLGSCGCWVAPTAAATAGCGELGADRLDDEDDDRLTSDLLLVVDEAGEKDDDIGAAAPDSLGLVVVDDDNDVSQEDISLSLKSFGFLSFFQIVSFYTV